MLWRTTTGQTNLCWGNGDSWSSAQMFPLFLVFDVCWRCMVCSHGKPSLHSNLITWWLCCYLLPFLFHCRHSLFSQCLVLTRVWCSPQWCEGKHSLSHVALVSFLSLAVGSWGQVASTNLGQEKRTKNNHTKITTLVKCVGSSSLSHTTHCFYANVVSAVLWPDAVFPTNPLHS